MKQEFIDEIKNKSIEYIQMYSKNLDKCEADEDYYKLITSIFVFQELVITTFKKDWAKDNNEDPDPYLNLLKETAKQISETIVKQWNENNLI